MNALALPPYPPYPPFPANPTLGQRFGSWVWNGARWVGSSSSGVTVVTQVFKASATYIPSPGLMTAVVECVGGGGGGGPASTTVATSILAGGGGGSGGNSRETLDASLVAGGIVVTVGAGGASQVAGGATSFGALCIANGGGPGGANSSTAGNNGLGGAPATPGVGQVNWPGSCGFAGIIELAISGTAWSDAQGGMGGQIKGGNQQETVGVGLWSGGVPAIANTGAGGSGAVINQTIATNIGGGPGASGICIVTEYCSVGGSDGDCSGQAPVSLGACGPGWGGPC